MSVLVPVTPATLAEIPVSWGVQVTTDLDTMLNPYIFTGRATGVQSLATGTALAINLDVEDSDKYAAHTLGSAVFTVPAAMNGWRVDLSGLVIFAANSTGGRGIAFQKNGSNIPDGVVVVGNAAAVNTYVQGSASVIVATGDTLQMMGVQYSGGALSSVAGCSFKIKFAGLS